MRIITKTDWFAKNAPDVIEELVDWLSSGRTWEELNGKKFQTLLHRSEIELRKFINKQKLKNLAQWKNEKVLFSRIKTFLRYRFAHELCRRK